MIRTIIRKYRFTVIRIFFAVFIICVSGCGALHKIEIKQQSDQVQVVEVYTFGCVGYIPEILVNKNDFSVWEYCDSDNRKHRMAWTAGPTTQQSTYFVSMKDVPLSFREAEKIKMTNCGAKTRGVELYCGEFPDAGYEFKQWKVGRFDNYLTYTINPTKQERVSPAQIDTYPEEKVIKPPSPPAIEQQAKPTLKSDKNSNNMTDKEVSDVPLIEKQFKLTFKPDQKNQYFTDREISDFFENAKSAGLDLNFRVARIDKESGRISLMKNQPQGNGTILAEVFVEVTQNRQTAYIYLTVCGDSESIVDSAMSEFKMKYASKFR